MDRPSHDSGRGVGHSSLADEDVLPGSRVRQRVVRAGVERQRMPAQRVEGVDDGLFDRLYIFEVGSVMICFGLVFERAIRGRILAA